MGYRNSSFVIIGAVVVLTTFGSTFLPKFNEGVLTITSVSIPGISLEETNKLNFLVGEKLMGIDGVELVTRGPEGLRKVNMHMEVQILLRLMYPLILKGRTSGGVYGRGEA